RVEDILHKDMRTNLKSFATWFHAYLSSPHRALLVKGETHLKRVIRLRKGSITTPMLEDVADEMRAAVNLWEQEPFHVGSVEYKRARLRMLRDIKVSGRWEEEIANGLQKLETARSVSTINDKAQVIVEAQDDSPQRKVDYSQHAEIGKQKNQAKLAARIQKKKDAHKAKTEKRNANRAKRIQDALPQSDAVFPIPYQHMARPSSNAGFDRNTSSYEEDVEQSPPIPDVSEESKSIPDEAQQTRTQQRSPWYSETIIPTHNLIHGKLYRVERYTE
ncbi:MAG: hypothetical protein L6R41_006779, partial [Letrouitia leprolyta]